jgi:TolA-binding protein
MRIHAFVITMLCVSAIARADDPLPTLDELLGISDQSEQAPETAISDELDDVLSERQAGEAFQQAVTLMDRVATRISSDNNIGIETQRMQEEIIRKLEKVIESAQQNQSSSSSSSSSSQQSPQNQPNQQQGNQQGNPDPSGDGDQPSTPPGLQEGDLADAPAPEGAGWGSLPERVREALTQGLNDTYSELYRKLTEDYFRSLAEDEQ